MPQGNYQTMILKENGLNDSEASLGEERKKRRSKCKETG